MIDQRRVLVELVATGESVAGAARACGVSRKTASKWVARFDVSGADGLVDRPRSRVTPSALRTSSLMVETVLELRDRCPTWGGRKIRARLIRDGVDGVPAASTITEILRRNDRLLSPQRPGRDFVRFRAPHPNDLWQMDFKGDFPLTAGGRCFPLTVLDDYSRYVVGLRALNNQRRGTVRDVLIDVFNTTGTPRRVLCDHGPPWGASGLARFTRLGVWLIEHGIEVIHGRPKHPQTQGKDERFHRTLKADVITQRPDWDTLINVQHALDNYLLLYNTYRPHQALDMDVPADHYQPSPRPFIATPQPPIYNNPRLVRTVSSGQIKWNGHRYRVGHAFESKPVEIDPTDTTITIRYYTTTIKTHPTKV